jgi:hypothetical protein
MTSNQMKSHDSIPLADYVEDLKASIYSDIFPKLLLSFHGSSTCVTSVIIGDHIVLHSIHISLD